ncbi:lipopolysaccharide assembly protein LapA domain-containing protein [Pseudomarimonas salicorniae]|uniref:Lipopolysaccharide assembly protein LapA domain-containing protein n=1 Tax=Pseudomarimonas salicorniae TaxID=2933270 RepID=A0ABT0GCH5_9GAMM|nr:lipopolysaccharide assembly protein LapA domain-containing protein [Lysobacter sp. CAU 1642]MCK7592231.1 lipopolysaccharide assembly protein LapA domain-containing protein [Lysobacter sp. CAU 1642]
MARRIKWITLGVLVVLALIVLAQNSDPVVLAVLWMSLELPLFLALVAALLTGMLLAGLIAALVVRRRRLG